MIEFPGSGLYHLLFRIFLAVSMGFIGGMIAQALALLFRSHRKDRR